MVVRMAPHRYRILIEGELGARYASAFDGMTVRPHHGMKEITGPIIDPLASPGAARTDRRNRHYREGTVN
jgi:hypothetical protein